MSRSTRVALAILAGGVTVPLLALALFRAWALEEVAHDSPQASSVAASDPTLAPPLEVFSEQTHNEFTRRAQEAAERAIADVRRQQQQAVEEFEESLAGQRGFAWPVRGGITSPFGPRGDGFHHGLDIGCGIGAPVRAAAAGRVTWSEPARVYGNTVAIDHGNGYLTLYAHLSRIDVANGALVSAGGVVGLCGSTGNSTGPHLHFEIRSAGYVHDPLDFLP